MTGTINTGAPVLSTDLYINYPQKKGVLRGTRIQICRGEIIALVGESGSGKTTVALSILRLLDTAKAEMTGSVLLLGQELCTLSEQHLRSLRGRIVSLVPQSPREALNPALRIETQVREAWHAHSALPWSSQRETLLRFFSEAGLPTDDTFLRRFPNEISVGQAQRVLIAMALLHSPALLVADEPTSALDLITQRDILALFANIRKTHGVSVLFISHDLAAVATVCDRVAILYDGVIVETAPVQQILKDPRHPYTQRLVGALPRWV